jgi:hypothetical protein
MKLKKSSGKASGKSSRGNNPDTGQHVLPGVLYATGKRLGEKCSRNSHDFWKRGPKRPDFLRLLEESNAGPSRT